ncbi:MAG: permease [Desulfobacterales bacterium]|nr:permease [Desulfobacterales bacterium]
MKKSLYILLTFLWCLFVCFSFFFSYEPGKVIGKNFLTFGLSLLGLLPPAFVLMGLFHVWVKQSTIMKHMGHEAGLKGHFWGILLASSILGGLPVALPVAIAIYSKGASLAVMLTFLGASCICRVPMTIFEASFLGIPFTLIRWAVSLPLIVLSSYIIAGVMRGQILPGNVNHRGTEM